jgi:hypothetical protein
VNVPVVAPAAIVIVAGTVALLPVAVRAIERPPVGAGPLIVTVAVEVAPPRTDVGFKDTPVTPAGLTVSVADAVAEPVAAVIEGVAAEATAPVVTAKVVVEEPAGTVTVAGTVAEEPFELVVTTVPPVGAGPVSVIVAVDEVPPVTDVGFRVSPLVATVGGMIVRLAELVLEPDVAVMVTGVLAATASVVTLKVIAWFPAVMNTDAGTVALALLEERVMVIPPVGAGIAR